MKSLATVVLLLAVWIVPSASSAPASTPAEKAKIVCVNAASNVHECGRQIREAASSTSTLEGLDELHAVWSDRYEAEVLKLRSGPVGLVKAKSDLQLIREEVSGAIEDEIKGKIAEGIAKKTTPKTWQKVWERIWSKYFKRISTFLSHPATKATVLALKVSMPSQIATDFDELSATNQGVIDTIGARMRAVAPPPTFLDTVRDNAYRMAAEKLGPQLKAAPIINRP